jgi:hypothetical protein
MEANIGALTRISDARTGQSILRSENKSQFNCKACQAAFYGDVLGIGTAKKREIGFMSVHFLDVVPKRRKPRLDGTVTDEEYQVGPIGGGHAQNL